MPLCPVLYKLLVQKFGSVKITSEGEAFVCRKSQTDKLDIINRGETYAICCPFCADTRNRLYISHRFAQHDPITQQSYYFLAHCFNENCLAEPGAAQRLARMIFGRLTCRLVLPIQKSVIEKPEVIPELPGKLIRLDELPEDHYACTYLRNRGFDPVTLGQYLDVSYCIKAKQEYYLAENRIIIPIYQNNILRSWQARYIGQWRKELNTPKYYNMPGAKLNDYLYNFDFAKAFNYVVVCEGPSDSWSIGKQSVATMGKNIKSGHVALIRNTWKNGVVVLLPDPDAMTEAEALYKSLVGSVKHLLIVKLAQDPGSTSRNAIWKSIESECKKHNIDLLNLK